jgi:hypothetical protein
MTTTTTLLDIDRAPCDIDQLGSNENISSKLE